MNVLLPNQQICSNYSSLETGGSFEHLVRRKTSPTLHRAPSIRSRLSNAPLHAACIFSLLPPTPRHINHTALISVGIGIGCVKWLVPGCVISSCSCFMDLPDPSRLHLSKICIRFVNKPLTFAEFGNSSQGFTFPYPFFGRLTKPLMPIFGRITPFRLRAHKERRKSFCNVPSCGQPTERRSLLRR